MYDSLFFKELASLAREAPKKVLNWEKQAACGEVAVELSRLIKSSNMSEKMGHKRAVQFLRAMAPSDRDSNSVEDVSDATLELCCCLAATLHAYGHGFHTPPIEELARKYCDVVARACVKMLPNETPATPPQKVLGFPYLRGDGVPRLQLVASSPRTPR